MALIGIVLHVCIGSGREGGRSSWRSWVTHFACEDLVLDRSNWHYLSTAYSGEAQGLHPKSAILASKRGIACIAAL